MVLVIPENAVRAKRGQAFPDAGTMPSIHRDPLRGRDVEEARAVALGDRVHAVAVVLEGDASAAEPVIAVMNGLANDAATSAPSTGNTRTTP